MVKRKKGPSTQPAASKKKGNGLQKNPVESLFDSYKDPNDDHIGPEGIERFCKDLCVNPSDRKILLLAWKMKAERMGFLSRLEFIRAFQTLGATSIAQMKKSLPKLSTMVSRPADFKDFYCFAFNYCLTEPGQRIIDTSTAAEMLPIVLQDGRFVRQFSDFLAKQTEYRTISFDQWQSFLLFSQEVREDMSNATDNPAWPVLIDNFVEWWRTGAGRGGKHVGERNKKATESAF